jgi:hypothetical protein
MSGFGALWRIRTSKHTRTMRSLSARAGTQRTRWSRLRETERLWNELARLAARRWLHEQRNAGQGRVGWR